MLGVQIEPKGCILRCHIGSKFREVRKILVEGGSPRVHVPVLWSRRSTKGVYKIAKNNNLSPENNQHQGDDVFGEYVDFESRNTKSSQELRHSHIFPAEFGLYSKYKEIDFAPMPENRISRNRNRFNQNDLSLTPEKVQKVVKTCQKCLRNNSKALLELIRVISLLSSTIQGVEPAKIQLRFLQQHQIVGLREKYELSVSSNIKH